MGVLSRVPSSSWAKLFWGGLGRLSVGDDDSTFLPESSGASYDVCRGERGGVVRELRCDTKVGALLWSETCDDC